MAKNSGREWKTVQLPKRLLHHVDKIVEIQELGYTSRSEFIKEAVRLRIEEIENNRRGCPRRANSSKTSF